MDTLGVISVRNLKVVKMKKEIKGEATSLFPEIIRAWAVR